MTSMSVEQTKNYNGLCKKDQKAFHLYIHILRNILYHLILLSR